MELAPGVEPSLDDLHAIQIGADGIAQGVEHEGRCLGAVGRIGEVAAHGDALFRRSSSVKSQPPKKRTIIRGPVVA